MPDCDTVFMGRSIGGQTMPPIIYPPISAQDLFRENADTLYRSRGL